MRPPGHLLGKSGRRELEEEKVSVWLSGGKGGRKVKNEDREVGRGLVAMVRSLGYAVRKRKPRRGF